MPKASRRTLTFDDQISAAVQAVDIIPEYVTLLEGSDWRAACDSFVATRDGLQSWADMEAADRRDTAAIVAALPEHLQSVFRDLMDRQATKSWIHEELAFALGNGVGRRFGNA